MSENETHRPLGGRRLVVTRPRRQGGLLAAKLEALGAEVLLAPTIRIEPPENPAPLDDAIHASKSGKYDWIVFTSVNAVEAFFGRAAEAPNAHYAAIGPATAEALETRGLNADIVPGRHVAEDVF